MHFENCLTVFHIWFINGNLPVESSRTKQCTIEYIRAVCCSKNNDSTITTESIHFNQQLIQCTFSFVITHNCVLSSRATDCIDFINENDTWSFFSCLLEQVAYTARSDSDK